VEHWWDYVLHNQTALRLKGVLRFEPGVAITSVPWILRPAVGPDEAYARPYGQAVNVPSPDGESMGAAR
jgi:hypothetical protein